jgi:hypothetical protein
MNNLQKALNDASRYLTETYDKKGLVYLKLQVID